MVRTRWAVVCTVLAMTALAACGESDDNATGGASPGAGSGQTLKIGVYGPEQIPQG